MGSIPGQATRGMGSIPGQGTKIPHVAPCGQKKKEAKKETEDHLYVC